MDVYFGTTAPFAALGFIKYNGMTAEKFVWAWFKSEFLMPKKLTFRSTNTYYEMMKPEMEHKQKEVLKANDLKRFATCSNRIKNDLLCRGASRM